MRLYATPSDGCFNIRTDLSTFWFAQKISVAGLTNRSREKYKTNILEYNGGCEIVRQSKIYEYNLIEELESGVNHKHYGFIVERETPEELISDGKDGIDMYSLSSINWLATKELIVKNDEQQEQIATLTKEIAELKEVIKKM